jgi:spore coat protein CotH
VAIRYEGQQWPHVAMRYKGGSTLISAVQFGTFKRGFRLDFDKYEDEFPGTKNQRFFGYDKLTFSSMATDYTFIKEIIASSIFRAVGLHAPRVSPVRLTLDIGDEGPVYWGMYAMIEDPKKSLSFDDDVLEGEGNLYKPEKNTWGRFNKLHFEKKTNEKEANFTDIQNVIELLNAPLRRTKPKEWAKNLEQFFDVTSFLRYIAVSAAIGNWDSYGMMPHNYYIYNLNGRLTWVPWDHNQCLVKDPRMATVMQDDVTEQWPLTRYLLDYPPYRQYYKDVLFRLVDEGGPMDPERLLPFVNQLLELVAPHVVGGVDAEGNAVEGESFPHSFIMEGHAGYFNGAGMEMQNFISERPTEIMKALAEDTLDK